MEYIIGVIVSLFVQAIKSKLGTDTFGTLLTVLVVSLVGASLYTIFGGSEFWPTIVQVLTVAGAFYTYIIQRFESSK